MFNIFYDQLSCLICCKYQWCSRDRYLQDRDRDLVKIPRRDRDFIKKLQDRDLKIETETRDIKICAFRRNSFNKCRHHFWPEFFLISDFFPTCFGCLLHASTTKISLNYGNFNLFLHFQVFTEHLEHPAYPPLILCDIIVCQSFYA